MVFILNSSYKFHKTELIKNKRKLQTRTKVAGKVVQLDSISAAFTHLLSMFNKNTFSFPKYPPFPQYINITITHSNSSVLYNIKPEGWGEKQKRGQKC